MKKLLVVLLLAGGAGVNVEAMDQRGGPYDFFGTHVSEQRSEQVRVEPESEVVHLSVEIVRKFEEMQQSMALMRREVDSLRKELRAKDAEIADLKKELEDKCLEIQLQEEKCNEVAAKVAMVFLQGFASVREMAKKFSEQFSSSEEEEEITLAECEEENKDE